jgi:hypothetical protein
MSSKDMMAVTKEENSNIHHDAERQTTQKKGVDQAAVFLAEAGDDITWTAEEERRVLRKVDMWLLPMVCVLFRTSTNACVNMQLLIFHARCSSPSC